MLAAVNFLRHLIVLQQKKDAELHTQFNNTIKVRYLTSNHAILFFNQEKDQCLSKKQIFIRSA